MVLSENWLRTWVSPVASRESVAEKLTMAGLEVEGVEEVAPGFSGVIIGEVTDCKHHHDAKKLAIVTVSTGKESVQVVCGAPNVRKGLKAPFAKLNAVLPGGLEIVKSTIRGVDSFGMLCSEQELGFEWSGENGLLELPDDAPVGMDLRDYLDLDDTLFDISLTPNRADCLSIAGIAREVAVNFDARLTSVEVQKVAPVTDRIFPASVEALEDCPRFVTRVIENIDVRAETPLWMKMRLQRSGIRSLDPVVDVTNYVMLELGQPMHGYDLDRLHGGLVVRHAEKGEKLTLLDDSEQELGDDTLLIADHEKPLGIAGIMGGRHSGIDENTRHILLETAYFSPQKLAGKARSYGLHTESSHRFERGVDYALQHKAMERATELVLSICGGQAGPVSEVVQDALLPEVKPVILRRKKLTALLGVDIDSSFVEKALTGLGFVTGTMDGKNDQWSVKVPSWRFDILVEEDLIEEIVRIYGYDNLPESTLLKPLGKPDLPEALVTPRRQGEMFADRGYHEVINFSMMDSGLQKCFSPDVTPVVLQNPIASDMDTMRSSLLPGLLRTLSYNLRRQKSRIRLFEQGQVFHREKSEGQIVHSSHTAAMICGQAMPESWHSSGKGESDFFDLKGDLEAFFQTTGSPERPVFEQYERAGMHPGQTASISIGQKIVGYLGAIHPVVLKQFDIKSPVYAFEIRSEALQKGQIPEFLPLSRFPEVRRDLAIIVDQNISCEQVIEVIGAHGGESFKTAFLFDVYSGQGVAPGKKSFAFGLTWKHPSRTLKDSEINANFDHLVEMLAQKVGAILRK